MRLKREGSVRNFQTNKERTERNRRTRRFFGHRSARNSVHFPTQPNMCAGLLTWSRMRELWSSKNRIANVHKAV